MEHHCHASRCRSIVPPAMFMCKKHWFMLPQAMRDAVWREYRPGQEERKVQVSAAYLLVTEEAENYIATLEGLPLPHPRLSL